MAKRLTEKQKKEIIQCFKDGKTVDFLSREFNCTKLTIIRNLKIALGELTFKELRETNKNLNKKNILFKDDNNKDFNIQQYSEIHKEDIKEDIQGIKNNLNIASEDDFYKQSFMEITPLDYEIDNDHRKELSSVPISDIDFPQIVYMIVDKKIELEIKLLKEFPEWGFLPIEDLNRKTIEIFYDLKIAKRFCNKEQKVIKVPNTNVFKIAAPFLISKGISRIVSADTLISL
ncbi:hypothetical protein EU99_1853 [Prochlorococcus marinus str. MIT 9321]|uniref:Uncharacterized protein n=1 Tax=Prochlorococcus marinus str. MIT 9401 TaxID=167551 RepID=A0A0A2B945_PROMR|nr:hypothetical protein [Prochlorococcus marinus]KGG02891.1 hypothetical protein EU99_1853 [Prochlorococcus marinus str. MIT 9321]KGG05514.1 hypothetical protein EV00_1148 [Prochlorococcus marinus str. MIT 9322]KGG10548.1 hypothetical protein EV01_0176 [Prochlorococcus marinus str. MIT 9401]